MRKLLILALAIVLVGCATPYQPFELFGQGGYQDKQISEDTYQVAYYGNSATNMQTLNSLLLYRTAELASEKSFDYFEVKRGYGRFPLSAYGGFKIVEHTVKMYKGQPATESPTIYIVSKVKEQFGPSINPKK